MTAAVAIAEEPLGCADLEAVVRAARRMLKPPPRLSLSEWADAQFVLSAETAAEPGRWHTLPYQKGIMDAITDPAVTDVSLMKSSRVGYTLMVSAGIGYFIDQDPSTQLVVQPTVDDAKAFSKETIAAMLRDVPVLARIAFKDVEEKGKGPKDPSNTLQLKTFPGGVLQLIGANSGAGFRRVSRRVIWFDEVDAYPPSAGSEGDQIRLGRMRAQAFWNRKIVAGSTPLLAGASRIERLFLAGDQRRYHVPCPTCGRMDFLTFREGERGHWMHWTAPDGSDAHFICKGCGCEIEHKRKREIIEKGEWRGDAPFKGHASFHIWAAYSYSPNATWADIAAEFLAANKAGPGELQTFVNTVLGETWVERGEAPDWQRLLDRREDYEIGTVPLGAVVLTAGVDVQKDRLVYEVVGWGEDLQSWSVEAGVIPGDTASDVPWKGLDALLARTWTRTDGAELPIRHLGVDSGFNTQHVYGWARTKPGRVIACKGVSTAKVLLGSPTAVDVKTSGKRLARGAKVWPVGVDIAKAELYGWLGLERPKDGDPYPRGYCHFPQYDDAFFKQMTAEHLVRRVKRNGFPSFEWEVIPGRENHQLDARVYARAAMVLCRLDHHAAAKRRAEEVLAAAPASAPAAPVPAPVPAPPPAARPQSGPRRSSWLGDRGGRGWLR